MSEQVIASSIQRLLEARLIGRHIIVCWHAGEPLTLPIEYYVAAAELIKTRVPNSCSIEFKVQTNGTLITEAWCEFFARYNVHVGVSIDGPAELHDASRKTRSGAGTFEHTLRGIRLLKQHGINFNIICVLTSESMKRARELFQFFSGEGIDQVCFNLEETEGIHRSELIAGGSSTERFRAFFTEYVRLALGADKMHWVREIDAPFRVLFTGDRDRTMNQQITPFSIVTIDWEGNLSTFSPELIGMSAPEFEDFKYGNVLRQTIDEMRETAAYKRTLAEIMKGVEKCRDACEYFPICGGGAPSNKFFENGSLSSSETAYCNSIIKTTADVLLDVAGNWRGDGDPPSAL